MRLGTLHGSHSIGVRPPPLPLPPNITDYLCCHNVCCGICVTPGKYTQDNHPWLYLSREDAKHSVDRKKEWEDIKEEEAATGGAPADAADAEQAMVR